MDRIYGQAIAKPSFFPQSASCARVTEHERGRLGSLGWGWVPEDSAVLAALHYE